MTVALSPVTPYTPPVATLPPVPPRVTLDLPRAVIMVERCVVVNTRFQLRDDIAAVIDAGATDVVLDCADTVCFDSSGMGVLVSGEKRARRSGARLTVVNLGDDLYTLFEVTHMETIIAFSGQVSPALTRIDTVLRIEDET